MNVRYSRTSKNVTVYNGPITVRSSRTAKNVTVYNGPITVRAVWSDIIVWCGLERSDWLVRTCCPKGVDLIRSCKLVVRTVRFDSLVRACCPNYLIRRPRDLSPNDAMVFLFCALQRVVSQNKTHFAYRLHCFHETTV